MRMQHHATIPLRLLLVLASLSAFAPLAIDLYLPSFGALANDLAVSFDQVEKTVSLFLLGYAAGMLVVGPISDRLGRRRVVLAGTGMFTLASLGCAWASSIESLQFWRILQALGGGGAAVVARAMVRDLFDEHQSARVMALLSTITSMAPLLAPIAGAWILDLSGWRAEFWTLAAFGVIAGFAAILVLPETHRIDRAPSSLSAAFRAYGQVLGHSQSRMNILSGGFLFAAMFAYITGTPFVILKYYGLTGQHYAMMFGLNIMGLMCMGWMGSRWVERWGTLRLIRLGGTLALMGCSLVIWSGSQRVPQHLPSLLLGLWMAVSALGFIAPNTLARLLAVHPQRAGAAAAVYGSAQFGLGAVASGAVVLWHDGTARPMTLVIGVLVILALTCVLRLNDQPLK